ncbi:MAG TPA: PEP/pyruvate-binding domain-containing protein [Nitrospiraceae bacterium]|nr:PEP/pyruvate-binding domain-containing protein [Nitrospiraceae bacterium]
MSHPHILPLTSCTNPGLAGGKAVGLQRLIRAGFRVPSGFCVTTAAYHGTLRGAGFDAAQRWKQALATTGIDRDRLLSDCRQAIRSATPAASTLQALRNDLALCSVPRWAARSSATDEDATGATHAGIYRTTLGVTTEGLPDAILDCWASLWTATALAYHERLESSQMPAMAVVLQPMLAPQTAGVAYSRHPVTGRTDVVVINAVQGLAEPLVSGRAVPDQVVVQTGDGPRITERLVADASRSQPVLSDHDAFALAGQIRAIEQTLGHAVDVEWALADGTLWFLQARAIPPTRTTATLTEPMCVWSRANFKETMPDLPSPLGISFLQEFMELAILRYYRTLGCTRPPGMSSVRIVRGRPYINVSLFQFFMAQLGGDPDSIADQMGGQLHPLPVHPPRLPLWKLLPAGLWMEWQMRRAARVAPRWFADMKRMAGEQTMEPAHALSPAGLLDRLDRLSRQLYERDLTFPTVGGVSQGLYVLRLLLERRLGREGHVLLNASLQGRSRVISAQQIFRLMELAETAGQEHAARMFFLAEPWDPSQFRSRLAGTIFLHSFDEYLADYGHRAVGESDMMSPRFAEMPEYLLGIIRTHLQKPPAKSVAEIRHDQDRARAETLRQIRAAFGWRVHEWLFFRWCHRRLARYLALREGNRHALMYFSMASRRLLLLMGRHFADSRRFAAADDIFFLTADEIQEIASGSGRDWKRLVAARQAERERNARLEAPDTIIGTGPPAAQENSTRVSGILTGLPISPGCVEGPARLVRSPDDRANVRPGDVLVVPVIDPGMAPLFGLAAGVVAEMGGTLSHGAIIVREYGLPAVANVEDAMRQLTDGERVLLDASRGEVRRLEPGPPA